MATYYVSTSTGNNGNNGTSPSTPWATLTYALGGSTAVTSGDTIYVAPGVYRENVVVSITSPTANTKIIGSTDGTLFTTVPVGYVRITSASSDNGSFSGQTLTGTSKNYIWLENLLFEGSVQLLTSANMTIVNCSFYGPLYITSPSGLASNATITKCIFVYQGIPAGQGMSLRIDGTGTSVASGNVIKSCLIHHYGGASTAAMVYFSGSTGTLLYNCSFFGSSQRGIWTTSANVAEIYNSLFCGYFSTAALGANSSGQLVSNYNRFIVSGTVATNAGVGANSITSSASIGIDFGSAYQFGLPVLQPTGSFASSPNTAVGTATGALAVDTFNTAWSGATPDAGGATYAPIGSTSFYFPTERNASAITIAPGSTSQSIELYLGATGLTASTSGLSARYNRTRTSSVSIPLVARTIAQAWTSGGFAEVDSTNMPGVYRLDLPDAALAAGADDVTIVVRGASGTNGAVMTVKLSSGGLTSAQTASAVWGASPAGYNDATTFGGVVNQIDQTVTGTSTLVQDIPSNVWQEETNDHTTHGTYGYNILRADAPSKEGLVTLHQSGGISRIDADIHAIVNDTAAAAELKGALLHTGGDYITADLLNPVASAQTLRIGPFGVRADGGGADDALDLNQSTAASIVVQMTDGQGTGIDQTSATVQAKVYNVAGALVATYTCTAAYALGGYMSIPMTTTVTGTAGSYIINLWSTVGSTVTVYGPLQLRVRAI